MDINHIVSSDFFVLRTPVFSVTELKNFNEKTKFSQAKFENFLSNFFDIPYVNQALYLASRELYEQYNKLKKGLIKEKKQKDKIWYSLYRYFIRAHSRSTPFGLFSGFALGEFSDEDGVVLFSYNQHTKNFRIDYDWLFQLSKHLEKDPSIKKNILYEVNPTLYHLDDSIRYIEYSFVNNHKKYFLTKLNSTEYLKEILERLKRKKRFEELVFILTDKYEVEVEEAVDYVNLLIDNQVIVSDLSLNVTGEEYFERILKNLKNIGETNMLPMLSKLRQKFLSTKEPIELVNELKKIGINHNLANFLQADLNIKTKSCKIKSEYIDEIISQIKKISFFHDYKITEALDEFKLNFISRFGNKEIPLMEALDPDGGIGFGRTTDGSLIGDIFFSKEENEDSDHIKWNKTQSIIFEKYLEAEKTGKRIIKLTDADISQFGGQAQKIEISDSSYLFGSIVREGDKFKFILNSLDGPSSSRLIGRFCSYDNNLYNKMVELLEKEQIYNKDSIIAEIIYIPQNRAGNILMRPILRKYEIPIMGNSTLPEDQVISLSDIVVSVVNNKIVLRSKSLNKKILPRESSALFPSKEDPPIYSFLSYLTVQENPISVGYRWQSPLTPRNFLPRIEYKNIILSSAKWYIFKRDLSHIMNEYTTLEKRVEFLIRKYKIPSIVRLKTGEDRFFLLDLEHYACMSILLKEIDKSEFVVLEEDFMYDCDDSLVKNENQYFFENEVIIPLTTNRLTKSNISKQLPDYKSKENTILPGEGYLYFKIYINPGLSDNFLASEFICALKEIQRKNLIKEWFFIRYSDPKDHLRIRLISNDTSFPVNEVMSILNPMISRNIESKIINDYCISPYKQEINVYGKDFILLTESIFYIDSCFAIQLISYIQNHEKKEKEKIKISSIFIGIRDLFDIFCVDIKYIICFMTFLSENYFVEFKGDKLLKIQLDKKFRDNKSWLFDLAEDKVEKYLDDKILSLLYQRKQDIIKIYSFIAKKAKYDNSVRDCLLERFIHLFINRIFNKNQRKIELLLYHLIKNTYVGIDKRRIKNIIASDK